MHHWLKKRIARIPRWESRLAFADWIWRGISFGGTIAVGWWTAARAWSEGVIAPYGTLGYVGVILSVATVLTLILMGIAWTIDKIWPRKVANSSKSVAPAATMPPLTMIKSQFFDGKHVVIDGKHFAGCEFKNCTIEYNGGHFDFTACKMTTKTIHFVSRNQSIINTLEIARHIGFFDGNVRNVIVPPQE